MHEVQLLLVTKTAEILISLLPVLAVFFHRPCQMKFHPSWSPLKGPILWFLPAGLMGTPNLSHGTKQFVFHLCTPLPVEMVTHVFGLACSYCQQASLSAVIQPGAFAYRVVGKKWTFKFKTKQKEYSFFFTLIHLKDSKNRSCSTSAFFNCYNF